MKLKDARAIPAPSVWSGHTDAALMKEVRHYFPTPGPLLAELFDRFQPADDVEDVTAECPACGTVLKVDNA